MNEFASVEQLQAAAGKRRYETVVLPTSNLSVRIQSLQEVELAEYETAVIQNAKGRLRTERLADACRRLLVLCVVDLAGNRLYRSDQAHLLKEWDALDTQCLYEACRQHVGVGQEDIEELVKNCAGSPADDTPSGSQTD